MSIHKVGVITPTTHDREALNDRCREIFARQDYENRVHLLDYSDMLIGAKRNRLCQFAVSVGCDIILHMDSDDLYSDNWISSSIDALVSTNSDIVGLRQSHFYDSQRHNIHLYEGAKGTQLHLLGATLCYWTKVWHRKPFNDNIHAGEDNDFITNAGKLSSHNNQNGFTAIVHGKNTDSHKAIKGMRKVDVIPELVQRYYLH